MNLTFEFAGRSNPLIARTHGILNEEERMMVLENLLAACEGGDEVTMETILDSCPDLVTAADPDHGNSILHFSAYNGHLHMVQKLLKRGADIEQKNVG
eukprot:g5928.t1